MPEPCRSCDRREIDLGACRCQALALIDDARVTDPARYLSPHHAVMAEIARGESAQVGEIAYAYRRMETQTV